MKILFKNAKVVSVFTLSVIDADVLIDNNAIIGVDKYDDKYADIIVDVSGKTIIPSFIDGHIHVESTMLLPQEFARACVSHGTGAIVADPHEIANVCGKAGIEFMIECSRNLPMDFYYMLPSCVPATKFDESAFTLNASDLRPLYDIPCVLGLAEMMNYVGVINEDEDILQKINDCHQRGMIVDGHAPLLNGVDLDAYLRRGINSDHECCSITEATEKMNKGQYIMVRQGTVAKNLESLIGLFQQPYCNRALLVTDDKHPADIKANGHIDSIIRQAVALGAPILNCILMATLNVAKCFDIKYQGAIALGYKANFIILNDLETLDIDQVYHNGRQVYANNTLISKIDVKLDDKYIDKISNTCHIKELTERDLYISGKTNRCRVINVNPGQLLTDEQIMEIDFTKNNGINIDKDILKIAVAERHHNTGHIGLGFIHGIGLKSGAICSTVAHDSHNLIIIGTNELDMITCANAVTKANGGCAVACDGKILFMQSLPIAGLMSTKCADEVARDNDELIKAAHSLGIPPEIAPFLMMSFVSLPVIPHLKMTTFGLIDVDKQQLVDLFVEAD